MFLWYIELRYEKYVTKQNFSAFILEKNQILPSVVVVTGTSVISDGGVIPSIPSKIVSMSACKSVVWIILVKETSHITMIQALIISSLILTRYLSVADWFEKSTRMVFYLSSLWRNMNHFITVIRIWNKQEEHAFLDYNLRSHNVKKTL